MLMPMASGTSQGVAATTLTLGCLGFARGGFSVNHMDIAPKYAGVVMGISNTAGACLVGCRSFCPAHQVAHAWHLVAKLFVDA